MKRAKLAMLRIATNDAIALIQGYDVALFGAINWADLSCRQASLVVTDAGESYTEVLIEEAAPDATKFQQAVASELALAGWPDVRVVTEW